MTRLRILTTAVLALALPLAACNSSAKSDADAKTLAAWILGGAK